MISTLKNRLERMDPHLHEVLKGAVLAFGLRVVGAGAAFGLNVAIGRILGASGAGLYFLALSVASFAAIIAQAGLGGSLLRFISAAVSKGAWGTARGVFAQGGRWALITGAGLAFVIAATAPWSSSLLFAKPALAAPLRWASLGVVSLSMMTLLAESLKGLKQIGRSMLVTGVIYPLVALALIWPLARGFGPSGAVLAYVLGTSGAALAGLYWWRHATADKGAPRPLPAATLWASAGPLLFSDLIMRGVIPMAPMFFIGIWGDAADTGIFGAATRLALLTSFFLAAVNTAVAPKFSELFTKGDIKMLAHVARRFALGTTLLTSPLFVVMFFASDWVMGLFGPDFTRGGSALAILGVGQLVNAMSGPVGFMLMMSGHERDMRNGALVAALTMVALAFVLVPAYSLNGAAIAASAALITINLYGVVMVYRRLKIMILPFMPAGGRDGD